ncbi:MAG: OmpA family protein, partial [Gimesia sp.]|nr:OmpA family protein [Gimesia sp.]
PSTPDAADINQKQPENFTDRLQNMIADKGLQNLVEIKFSDGLVDLQLQDSVLFPSGSAELLESGSNVLKNLLPLLKEGEYLISVQGHTDSVPISTTAFPSNWELSGARAAAVVRGLIDLGISESRLELTGLAHTRPVDDNSTEQGRRKNRRVNILLHASSAEIEAILSK